METELKFEVVVRKFGGSVHIILPKRILETAGIGNGDTIRLTIRKKE
jgi:antitoxin component of MazEF toxin-antitoxin module